MLLQGKKALLYKLVKARFIPIAHSIGPMMLQHFNVSLMLGKHCINCLNTDGYQNDEFQIMHCLLKVLIDLGFRAPVEKYFTTQFPG